MPSSQYLAFGIGGGSGSPNTLSPAAYAALTTLRANGFQPGIAKSEEINTVLRQVSVGVAGLGQFCATHGSLDVLDDGSPANFAAAVEAAVRNIVSGLEFFRPGDIKATLVDFVPPGWLKANGQIVSRSAYAELFAAIGTTHGAGDGTTTFRLPDLRAEFLRGWDDGRGVDSGRALGSWQSDAIKAHTHSVAADNGGFNTNSNNVVSGTDRTQVFYNAQTSSFGEAETRGRNVATLFLIKA